MTAREKAPLRRVKHTKVGSRSRRITFPNGDTAIICGPPPREDTLECGHVVVTWGGRADRRRCEECRDEAIRRLLDESWLEDDTPRREVIDTPPL